MADNLILSSPTGGYLSALNEEQRQAVETTEGPLLILAGAGTGKTRVLTTRFAHILLQGHAWPEQILAVTFTNKAAREMRERIGTLLDKPVEGLWLGTFHALCARMLRRHAECVGLERDFTILDTDDQIRLLKQIMGPFHIDTKRWPASQILHQIQSWKDRALLPQDITPAHDSDVANGHARAVYEAYQNRLRALNACDFGDLMLHMVTIFRTHPEVLEQYHRRFHYILVDEYQDTNAIQYLWLRLLAKRPDNRPANIACVGDDDQSIYSWRGAEVENILRFEKDFPGAHVVRLERNYRSTPSILGAAGGVIAHNEERLGKTLHAGIAQDAGELVHIINTPDSDDEARTVGTMAQKFHQEDGQSYGDMAVLMRAGFQTRPFEESLMRLGIPYQVVGGLRFYERAEIRDGTAYMRALVQPSDDLAFERIINVPKRGIGNVSLGRLRETAQNRQLPLQATIQQMLENRELKGKAAGELQNLLDAFARARETLSTQGHVVAVEQLLEECGYFQMWRDDRSIEAPGRLDNLRELLRAIGEFPTLPAFLEHIALVMDTDRTQDEEARISLMTLHGAKGLEFDTVFLPGWEEGIFPSQRSMDEGGNKAVEEERRLAYVGLTRARKRAIILHADSRRIYATWQDSLPSRFLEELPDKYVTRTRLKRPPSSFGHTGFGSGMGRGGLLGAAGEKALKRPSGPRIPLGTNVRHARFGTGVVTAVEDNRLTINFEEAGQKRIMADFVEILS